MPQQAGTYTLEVNYAENGDFGNIILDLTHCTSGKFVLQLPPNSKTHNGGGDSIQLTIGQIHTVKFTKFFRINDPTTIQGDSFYLWTIEQNYT